MIAIPAAIYRKTGRTRFRGVRFHTPNSVSFFGGSLSSGERTQWVPFSLLFVCQSELTEFLAELTEFAAELNVSSLFRNSTLETVFRPFSNLQECLGPGPESAPWSAFSAFGPLAQSAPKSAFWVFFWHLNVLRRPVWGWVSVLSAPRLQRYGCECVLTRPENSLIGGAATSLPLHTKPNRTLLFSNYFR